MRVAKRLWTLVLLIALGCALAGCGGGGGGGSSQDVVFTPNYISSLDSLNHWSVLPIKVYFALPADWTNTYPADLPAQAAQSWNISGKQAFYSVVGSQAEADVTCSFVPSPLPKWGVNTVAVTEYSIDTSQHLMVPGTVSVICALHDVSGRALGAAQVQTSIAHELGHALGISGHSPNPSDLLYALEQPGITTPQVRDLNTAMTAYQAYFGTGAKTRGPEIPNPSAIVHRQIP